MEDKVGEIQRAMLFEYLKLLFLSPSPFHHWAINGQFLAPFSFPTLLCSPRFHVLRSDKLVHATPYSLLESCTRTLSR